MPATRVTRAVASVKPAARRRSASFTCRHSPGERGGRSEEGTSYVDRPSPALRTTLSVTVPSVPAFTTARFVRSAVLLRRPKSWRVVVEVSPVSPRRVREARRAVAGGGGGPHARRGRSRKRQSGDDEAERAGLAGPGRNGKPLAGAKPGDRVGNDPLLTRGEGIDDRSVPAGQREHPRCGGVGRFEARSRRPAVRERQLGDEAGSSHAGDVEDDRDEELGTGRALRRGAQRRKRGRGVEAVAGDAVAGVRDRRTRRTHRRLHLDRPSERFGAEEEGGDAGGVGRRCRSAVETGEVSAALSRRLGAVRRGEDVEPVARVGVAGDLVGRGSAVAAPGGEALRPSEEARADGRVVDRADGERVAHAGRVDDAVRAATVPARRHDQDAGLGEKVEGGLVVGRLGVAAAGVRGLRVVEVAAERQVDDADAVGIPRDETREDGVEALDDLGVGPLATVVEDAYGGHLRAPGDPRSEAGDHPGDRRAVAVAVLGVAVVIDGVVEIDHLRPERQLGMRVVDAGVDDGHRYSRPFDARRPQLRDLHQRLALGIENTNLAVEAHALDSRVAREGRHGGGGNAQEEHGDVFVRPGEADTEGGVLGLEVLSEAPEECAPEGLPRREDADAPRSIGKTERHEDLDIAAGRAWLRKEPRVRLLDRAARVGGRPEPLRRERRRGRRRDGECEREKRGGSVSPHASTHGK